MKMLKMHASLKAVALCLFALTLMLQPASSHAQTTTKTDSHTNWTWQDGDWKKSLEIRGRVEFTDDYTDIRSVSEGGSVRIEETQGGTTRRLDVAQDAGGQLRRSYYVDGQQRPMNEQDRAWVARMILDAVRQSAIDADKRVQRIFERRGLSGVLEEISLLRGDYSRRIYFGALVKNGNLDGSALQTVLRESARQISSDYEQAQLLISIAELSAGRGQLLPAFFEATDTIKSDYEHRRVLSAVLKRRGLGHEVMGRLLESAARISSDYEKATLLLEASGAYGGDARLRDAFLRTVETIKSDYERGRVLSAMLKNKQMD
ncbi:MAG TPA: hypothetical protein VJS44_19085 [Pyrinomonadaceae bacterium]|nr:hypothetical protein [Pyrinomonadaceae bacterium]